MSTHVRYSINVHHQSIQSMSTWYIAAKHYIKPLNHHSCIDIYSYSCLHPLSNERKSMFKSGDSRAV